MQKDSISRAALLEELVNCKMLGRNSFTEVIRIINSMPAENNDELINSKISEFIDSILHFEYCDAIFTNGEQCKVRNCARCQLTYCKNEYVNGRTPIRSTNIDRHQHDTGK
jgi:hypothetical protein